MQPLKQARSVAACAVASFGLMFPAVNAPAQYEQSDLTGTWASYQRRDNQSANAAGYKFGTTSIDGTGNVTGGEHTDNAATTVPHTGGSVTVSSSGSVEGSITNVNGTDTFRDHQLDETASLIVGIDADSEGFVGLNAAIKQTGTYSTLDLEGRWRYIGMWDLPAPSFNGPGWDHLQIHVDDQGIVTSTAGFGSDGPTSLDLTGSQITIDSAGRVGISDFPEAELQMMPSTTEILGVAHDTAGRVNFVGMIRDENEFSTADLEGRWHYYFLWDGTDSNRPNVARGVIDLDAEGVAQAATYEIGGNSFAVAEGAFSVSLGGAINGALELEGGSLISFKDVRLNYDANLGVSGYTNGLNRVLTVWVLPEPAGAAPALTALLALLAMRSMLRCRHGSERQSAKGQGAFARHSARGRKRRSL